MICDELEEFNPPTAVKVIRAHTIKDYLYERNKYDNKVVCFSCGNASRALKDVGLDVLNIGAKGDFIPTKWFRMSEIAELFPNRYDATCGHLSFEMMRRLADRYSLMYRDYIGDKKEFWVPTGSGETIICLAIAFPDVDFHAVYNLDVHTEYHKEAPLNEVVKHFAKSITFYNRKEN